VGCRECGRDADKRKRPMGKIGEEKTRHVAFAFLFLPLYPEKVFRSLSSKFSERIIEEGYEDLEMRYVPGTHDVKNPKPGKLVLKKGESDDGGPFGLTIDQFGNSNAERFLLVQTGPNWHLLGDKADTLWGLARDIFPIEAVLHAEVTMRMQAHSGYPSAIQFFRKALVPDGVFLSSESQPSFSGVSFELPPRVDPGDPMSGPARKVNVETLREEESEIYIECRSIWMASIQQSKGDTMTVSPGHLSDVGNLRMPSEYIKNCHEFIHSELLSPLRSRGKEGGNG
jgi:hypothetical protein